MRLGDGADLVRRLRQCDVERRFSLARAFKKEVQAECRLSRSGVALYKMKPTSRETAREYVIEAGNTRGNLWRRGCHTLESPAKPGPSGPVDYLPAEAQASTREVGCPQSGCEISGGRSPPANCMASSSRGFEAGQTVKAFGWLPGDMQNKKNLVARFPRSSLLHDSIHRFAFSGAPSTGGFPGLRPLIPRLSGPACIRYVALQSSGERQAARRNPFGSSVSRSQTEAAAVAGDSGEHGPCGLNITATEWSRCARPMPDLLASCSELSPVPHPPEHDAFMVVATFSGEDPSKARNITLRRPCALASQQESPGAQPARCQAWPSGFNASDPCSSARLHRAIRPGGDAMKPIALIFAMLLAASASAEAIKEWRTPDGKTFFGDHPPEGSTVVKTVDKPIGTVETQPVSPQERAPLAEPQTVWRTNIACQELSVTDVKEEGLRLSGTLTHDGRHIVKDVRVCRGVPELSLYVLKIGDLVEGDDGVGMPKRGVHAETIIESRRACVTKLAWAAGRRRRWAGCQSWETATANTRPSRASSTIF